MKLYLARHGESEDNATGLFAGYDNLGLSKKGFVQAVALRDKLENIEFGAVVSNGLKRCIDTVLRILGKHPDITDSRFNERCNGDWGGISKVNFKTTNPLEFQLWRDGILCPPNGEDFLDLETRVLHAFHEFVGLFRGHDVENVLFVISGNPIRAILGSILQIPMQKWQYIELDNCGLSVIRQNKDIWSIECVNDTSHLKDVGLGKRV